MSRAVRFDRFGGTEVLKVVEVERPVPAAGEVLVQVRAAGINPVESAIRGGLLQAAYPTVFPAGQGKDVAGVVAAVGGPDTGLAAGDEVIGFTVVPGTHAEFVVLPAEQLTRRPAGVSWEQAGALYTAGAAAYASVRAVGAGAGDTVVVANAAGGVGSVAVQLARLAGATVIGLAGEKHHGWLRTQEVVPVGYGAGAGERVFAASGGKVDAFIDAFGAGYVDVALALGVEPDRITTLIDFAAVAAHGVQARGSRDASSAAVLAELAQLIDAGRLHLPIEAAYPLDDVAAAYDRLDRRHTLGKIVMTP